MEIQPSPLTLGRGKEGKRKGKKEVHSRQLHAIKKPPPYSFFLPPPLVVSRCILWRGTHDKGYGFCSPQIPLGQAQNKKENCPCGAIFLAKDGTRQMDDTMASLLP